MTHEISTLFTFLVALFASLFVMPKLSYIANRIGLIDQPNARKMHKTPRPLVGGLGIVISATFSSLVFVPLEGMRGFFSGLAVLLLVGFFDDYMEVGHRKKFLAQIVATALLIYLSKVQLSNFGNLLGFGEIVIPSPVFLVWGVTVFCVVGVTNAVNMIDGLDGLAGGVSFLAFLAFAVISSMAGNIALMLLNLAFSGAILGFLKYNWSPSVLFMGDSGSLCLGFALSFMAIALTQPQGSIAPPVCMLLVLAVPISDTLGVMTKRILRRTSPFKPDNIHLHHTLLQVGVSANRCVVIILLLSVLFCSLGICAILLNISESFLFFVFLGYFFINYFLSSILKGVLLLIGPIGRKKQPVHSTAPNHSIVQGRGKWTIFRAAHRYDVNLPMTCYANEAGLEVSGRIINISKNGFLAYIYSMEEVCQECKVVVLVHASGLEELNFAVEHLWMTEDEGGQYHGFRFRDMTNQQSNNLKQLLDTARDGDHMGLSCFPE